jgi:hypothetical protein
MAKGPRATSISGSETPEPPLNPKDVAAKVAREARGRPAAEKAKRALTELDKEVSGEYEAKQDETSRHPMAARRDHRQALRKQDQAGRS